MSERTIQEAQKELESLASRLIEKYPGGYLSEIEVAMPHCGIAIRAPLHGLDTPRAIIQGSYQELRAFENVYNRLKRAAKIPNTALIDAYAHATTTEELEYRNQKAKMEA